MRDRLADEDHDQPFRWHYDDLEDRNFVINGGTLLVILFTVSAILLFTILCLCISWACRRFRRPPPPTYPPTLTSVTVTPLPPTLQLITVASTDEISTCSICLSGLLAGQKVRVLPGCSHAFHPECVDEWLRLKLSCPMCRAALAPPVATAETEG